jgi:hypothetical protein
MIESLQVHCVRNTVKHCQWGLLSTHIQRCLIPSHFSFAIGRFQRHILFRRRKRMAEIIHLLTTQLEFSLLPKDALQVKALDALAVMRRGEHMAVMSGGTNGYGHHGIYIGIVDQVPIMVDFSSPTGHLSMSDGYIRTRKWSDFVGDEKYVYIIPYSHCPDVDENRERENAINLAVAFSKMSITDICHEYDIIRWNCETFALTCKTGQYRSSEQVITVFKAIQKDIFSQNSKIEKVVGTATRFSGSSCIVM